MEKNKTGKYLKYAIGEIILVVIGILIALSINNWNQNIQTEKEEITYYCKILEDIRTDKENINKNIESSNNNLTYAKRALSNLYKGTEDKSLIIDDFYSAVRGFDFVPVKAAINDITSSGKLGILKKSDLKESILQHYSDLEEINSIIEHNSSSLIDYIYKYDIASLGLHQTSIYKDSFEKGLLDQMPNVNWQKDKNHKIYKQFEEHMILSAIAAEREIDLLNQIFQISNQLEFKLIPYCE